MQNSADPGDMEVGARMLAQAREAVVAAATVEEAADTTAEHWIFPQPLWLN